MLAVGYSSFIRNSHHNWSPGYFLAKRAFCHGVKSSRVESGAGVTPATTIGQDHVLDVKSLTSQEILNIVVDCGFQYVHCQKEHYASSRKSQIMQIHSSIASENNPVSSKLHITREGCDDTLRMFTQKRNVRVTKKAVWEVFPRDRLVFLTPDSDNILQDVTLDHVYVFGGIADRTEETCLTRDYAEKHGIRHARLPLFEATQVYLSSTLSIRHAVEVLLRYAATGDWFKAVVTSVPSKRWVIEK